jgi:uncharacterized membrane protein
MTQDSPPEPAPENPTNEYDLKPTEKESRPKPGDPDFVPPTPVILPADIHEAEPEPAPVDPDIANNKAMGILAYILFVIPLVAAPQSKFARFHANQGLLVFIVWCIAILGATFIEVGWSLLTNYLYDIRILWVFLGCICHVVPVLLLVGALGFAIAGIINAANGEAKPLPLIGHWTLIK